MSKGKTEEVKTRPISFSGLEENTQESSSQLSTLSRDELYWGTGLTRFPFASLKSPPLLLASHILPLFQFLLLLPPRILNIPSLSFPTIPFVTDSLAINSFHE